MSDKASVRQKFGGQFLTRFNSKYGLRWQTEAVAETGSLKQVKFAGSTLDFDEPLQYRIVGKDDGVGGLRLLAQTRSSTGQWNDYGNTWDRRKARCRGPRKALEQLKRRLVYDAVHNKGACGLFGATLDRRVFTRDEMSQMLRLATMTYLLRGDEWGRIYSELAVDEGLVDLAQLTKRRVVNIYEIKSCRADFKSDRKWQKYIQYGNDTTAWV